MPLAQIRDQIIAVREIIVSELFVYLCISHLASENLFFRDYFDLIVIFCDLLVIRFPLSC